MSETKDGFKLKGTFTIEHFRKVDGEYQKIDEWKAPNLVVDEGLNHALDSVLGGAAQIPTWYVGIFKGNYTPVAGVVASTIVAQSTEMVDYDEVTRPLWDQAGALAQSITNSASKAQYTISAGIMNQSLYGMFLISTNTKGGGAGTLFSATRFAAAKVVSETDLLAVSYTVSAA